MPRLILKHYIGKIKLVNKFYDDKPIGGIFSSGKLKIDMLFLT